MKTAFRRALLAAAAATALAHAAPALAEKVPEKAQACMACHGPNGNSKTPGIPSLAGQKASYLKAQLKDYQEGRRANPMMTPMAQGLSAKDVNELSAFFADQDEEPTGHKGDAAKVALGRQKVADAACAACHGAKLGGQANYPRIAGQQVDYLKQTLQDFKAGRRTNGGGIMNGVMQPMTDADIEAMAQYLTGL